MSKIGKISISIPEKVKVALSGNLLNIEGPIGKKSLIKKQKDCGEWIEAWLIMP